MWHYKENHLPYNYDGLFFLQKASYQTLGRRSKYGDFREADVDKPFVGFTFDKYVKNLARRCKFTDAER